MRGLNPRALMHWGTFAAVVGVLAMGAGCRTTPPAPPPRALLLSGGIGVAAFLSPNYEARGPGGLAGKESIEGASGTIKGIAYVPPIVLLAPFFAVYGAVHGAWCEQKLEAAYPNLQATFGDIVRREFSVGDVREAFVSALQKQTTMQVAAVESSAGSDVESSEQKLLEVAAPRSLAYLLIVGIPRVEMTPTDRDCESWEVRVPMAIEIWSVADRKLVLRTESVPFVRSRLDPVKALFDEPGSLRTKLVTNFRDAAEDVLSSRPFRIAVELPQ